MAVAEIANIFNTLDKLTDNQLRMVKGYATDLLAERATERARVRKNMQNVPEAVATGQRTAVSSKTPEGQRG